MPTSLVSPAIEQRVNELLEKMTFEEKIGHTNQLIHLTAADREDLAFSGLEDCPVIEPGRYHVWIGPSSAEGLQGELEIR